MKRILAALLIAAGGVALPACGGKQEDAKKPAASTAGAKKPEGKPLLMGESKPKPVAGAPAAPSDAAPGASKPNAAPALPVSSVPLDTSSPEAALRTYLGRLADGDLQGASEACKPGAEGTLALERTATGFKKAAADNMDPKMLAGMLTGDVKAGVSTEKKTEEPERVVFSVTVGKKQPQDIEVVKVDGAWRVAPPKGGIP